MATLQVRDIDERLYRYLRTSAKLRNRSISQEVVSIIEAHLNSSSRENSNATLQFLSLSGAWDDERPAEEIIRALREGRNDGSRFGGVDGVFD